MKASVPGADEGAAPTVHRLLIQTDESGRRILEPAPDERGLDRTVLRALEPLLPGAVPAQSAGEILIHCRVPERGSALIRYASDGEVRVVWLPRGGAPPAGFLPIDPSDTGALVEFARTERERLALVLDDLQKLFAQTAGPQLLLVERNPGDVTSWIALLCASLPPRLAQRLTFTTFTDRPYEAYQQVVGIAPETVHDLTEDDLLHTYRVRSAEGRRTPGEQNGPWAALAAKLWLAGHPDVIAADPSVPSDDDFDAERLAVLALLKGVDPEGVGAPLAAEWMAQPAKTASVAQEYIDVLLRRLPTIDAFRGARARKAFLGLRRRATPELSEEIGFEVARLEMEAALADPASVVKDPLAPFELENYKRIRLSTEYGERLLSIFNPEGPLNPPQLRGAFVLADAVRLNLDETLDTLTGKLSDRLLGSIDEVRLRQLVTLLEDQALPDLTKAVLDRLERQALDGAVDKVVALTETGAGQRILDLARTPALRAVRASLSVKGRHSPGFPVFEKLWDATSQSQDRRLLRVLWDLTWPRATELTIPDAIGLARLRNDWRPYAGEPRDWIVAAFAERYQDPEDVEQLTDLALILIDRQVPLPYGLRVAVEWLEAVREVRNGTRPLHERVARLPGDTTFTSLPQALREYATDTLADHFARSLQRSLQDSKVVYAIIKSCDGRTLERYARIHREAEFKNALDQRLESAETAAVRFYIWNAFARSDSTTARAIGTELIRTFIEPILRRSNGDWRATARHRLQAYEGARAAWESLCTTAIRQSDDGKHDKEIKQ